MKTNKQPIFLHLISLVLILFVIAFFNPTIAAKLIGDTNSYGDLYQMSKIKDFKIKLPPLHPLPPFSSAKEADLIIMGDSFFNVGIGSPVFAQQLQDGLKLKVHNYNIQGSGETWRKTNPLEYLKQIEFTRDSKKRILILESVDRGIALRFSNINIPSSTTKQSSPSSPSVVSQNTDQQAPIGSIDGLNYQYDDYNLSAHGWAADYQIGAPLPQVSILVDDIILGSAEVNLSRPDVASHYNNQNWTQSGWSISVSRKLSPGKHSVVAQLIDNNNNQGLSLPKTIWISPLKSTTQKTAYINQAIQKQIKSLNYLLQQNIFGRSISQAIATTNFRYFKKISPLTPKYSLEPKFLFYQGSVDFNLHPPNQEEIDTIVENLLIISQKLKQDYNIDFLFIPMPTKYTIYKKLTGDQTETLFYQQLFQSLDKAKVNYVDLYTPFTNSNQLLYLASDTHWNENGVKLAVEKTIPKIKQILITQ